MSETRTLKDLYAGELKDLWSANMQMSKALTKLSEQAHDPEFKTYLTRSIEGIRKHNETVKTILKEAGAEVETEHCLGMEGLVREALKHSIQEAPATGELNDIEILAQYQRMSHYGIAGFGCAAAYAKALGMGEHETRLKKLVSEIYKSDEIATHLSTKTLALAAKQ